MGGGGEWLNPYQQPLPALPRGGARRRRTPPRRRRVSSAESARGGGGRRGDGSESERSNATDRLAT